MNAQLHSPDPVVEYYKQFVDRDALRENLKLTVDERLQKLCSTSAVQPERRQPASPDRAWEPVSDCGPARTSDPIIELYKKDVDRTLLRENLRRSVDERCQALVSMARLVDELHHQMQ
jgi:hypothetical protein